MVKRFSEKSLIVLALLFSAFLYSYSYSLNLNNNLQIQAFVFPEKVTPGDTLIITAKIPEGKIRGLRVIAEIEHENGYDSIELSKHNRVQSYEIWQGKWKVHSTVPNKNYSVVVKVYSFSEIISQIHLTYEDPLVVTLNLNSTVASPGDGIRIYGKVTNSTGQAVVNTTISIYLNGKKLQYCGDGLIGENCWWNESFPYRQKIIINNTLNNNTLYGYQVPINISYESGMQIDFRDMRFIQQFPIYEVPIAIYGHTENLNDYQVKIKITDANIIKNIIGKYGEDIRFFENRVSDPYTNTTGKLPYWIEKFNRTENELVVWVKVNLTANTSKTIYMYYGYTESIQKGYRKIPLEIYGHTENLNDYQVKIKITKPEIIDEIARDDAGDLRFFENEVSDPYTNTTGKLPYWIEKFNRTENELVVWVKVNLTANTSKTIWMYYGNAYINSESNGTAVFEFFDDFEGTSLDTGKWKNWTSGGPIPISVSNGLIKLGPVNDTISGSRGVLTIKEFLGDFVIETRGKTYSGYQFPTVQVILEKNNTDGDYRGIFAGYYGDTGIPDYWNVITEYGSSDGTTFDQLKISIGSQTDNWLRITTIKAGNYVNTTVYNENTGNSFEISKQVVYTHASHHVGLAIYRITETDYDWFLVRKYTPNEPQVRIKCGYISDGDCVFEFFDDFEDGDIDTNKWIAGIQGSGGSYSENNGFLILSASDAQTGSAWARTNSYYKTFTNNFVIEYKRKDTEQHYNDISFGYGNIVDCDYAGTTNWWHTCLQYGYSNLIQDNTYWIYKRMDGTSSINLQDGIDGPNAGQWIVHKIIYDFNGNWKWYADTGSGFVLQGTGQTDTTYLNNQKDILISRGGWSGGNYGGTSYIDWFLVRKYTSSEPVASTGIPSIINRVHIKVPYWIENKIDSSWAYVWIKVPYMRGGDVTNNLWMYYGNPNVLNESNGNDVFLFFDDFNRMNSSDLGVKWIEIDGGNDENITISNNLLSIESKNAYFNWFALGGKGFGRGGFIIEYDWNADGYSFNTNGRVMKTIGIGGGGDSGNPIIYGFEIMQTDSAASNIGSYVRVVNGTKTTIGSIGVSWPYNEWSKWKVVIKPDLTIEVESKWSAGTYNFTIPPEPYTFVNESIFVGIGDSNEEPNFWYLDNIRVRKYINPEPTVNMVKNIEKITSTDSQGNYDYIFKAPLKAGIHVIKVNLTDANNVYGENQTTFEVKMIYIYSPQNKTYYLAYTQEKKNITVNFTVKGVDAIYYVKIFKNGNLVYSNISFRNNAFYSDILSFTEGIHNLTVWTSYSQGETSESVVFTLKPGEIYLSLMHSSTQYGKNEQYKYVYFVDNNIRNALLSVYGDLVASANNISASTPYSDKIYMIFTKNNEKRFDKRAKIFIEGKNAEYGKFNFGYDIMKKIVVNIIQKYSGISITDSFSLKPGKYNILIRNLGSIGTLPKLQIRVL